MSTSARPAVPLPNGAVHGPRRGTTASAIAAGLAVATCIAASLSMGAGTPPADAAPVVQSATTGGAFLAGCGSEAVSSPLTVPIWCASSDQVLQDLTWSTWGGSAAHGVGSFVDNPCDCAGGQLHRYAVAVALDGRVAVGGTTRYERLRITFANARPAWATRTTMSFRWSELGFVTDQVLS